MTDSRGLIAPSLAVGFRLAVATTLWLATTLLHRQVSDAVARPLPTPWGAVTPIDHTTAAMVLVGFLVLALVALRARAAHERVATIALWGVWLVAVVVCHRILVTIDIEVIHYPQYALVAVLLARALDVDRQRRWLLEVVLVSLLFSVLDEGFQYFHLMPGPHYFDFNDLALNQIGTLAGLLWYYGFFRAERAKATGGRPVLAAMLAVAALCAAICGWFAATGILIVEPASAITHDPILRHSDGLRIVLQWTGGIYDNWRASRSGGTYFVLGPGLWLVFMAVTSLAVWAVERRLRAARGVPPRGGETERDDEDDGYNPSLRGGIEASGGG